MGTQTCNRHPPVHTQTNSPGTHPHLLTCILIPWLQRAGPGLVRGTEVSLDNEHNGHQTATVKGCRVCINHPQGPNPIFEQACGRVDHRTSVLMAGEVYFQIRPGRCTLPNKQVNKHGVHSIHGNTSDVYQLCTLGTLGLIPRYRAPCLHAQDILCLTRTNKNSCWLTQHMHPGLRIFNGTLN